MLSFHPHRTIKTLSVITLGFVVFIGFGVIVTRLTVHNLVDVSVYRCGNPERLLSVRQDNPLKRVAMSLGKSRVISVTMTQAELESFTIYHIPIGVITRQPALIVSVECIPASDENNKRAEKSATPVEIKWGTYTNNELGISMEIPLVEDINELSGGVGNGDTGKSTQVTIKLPSGSFAYGYAATNDYSAPKGSPGVGVEGYLLKEGKYYLVTRGVASQVEFIPDAIWETNNGSDVLVRYRKDYEKYIDYPTPFIQVLVNIPNSIFTGIGFIVVGHRSTQEIVSDDDIEILKKIVSTIKYI